MTDILDAGETRIFLVAPDGPALRTTQDFLDIIGALWGEAVGVNVVAIPARRLAPEFFDLRTGLAGDALQKFVNYRVQVVVVGEITAHVAASGALADFVRESNAGRHVWFCADLEELRARFTG